MSAPQVSPVAASSVKTYTAAVQKQHAARAAAVANLPPDLPRILRRPEVEAMVGLRKTALYDLMKAGEFPRPIRLGGMSRGWIAAEIAAWIEQKSALRG